MEAAAAIAAETADLAPLAPRPPKPYKKKGYVLAGPDGAAAGSEEPLGKRKRSGVRHSYADLDDGEVNASLVDEVAAVAAAWKRKQKQKRVAWGAELGGDPTAAAAGEGAEGAGGGGGEGGAAGGEGGSGILVDISRFYPDAPVVVAWIKGEPRDGVKWCEHSHLKPSQLSTRSGSPAACTPLGWALHPSLPPHQAFLTRQPLHGSGAGRSGSVLSSAICRCPTCLSGRSWCPSGRQYGSSRCVCVGGGGGRS